MTHAGIILGTAAYMAPEQARGKAVDRRADIWAFGVVLYEMLTGRRAFTGEDTSDVLAAVLRQEMNWSALPTNTPAALRRLLERCLDRDSKQRLRDIGEARVVLSKAESLEPSGLIAPSPAVATSSSRFWIAVAAGCLLTRSRARNFWRSALARRRPGADDSTGSHADHSRHGTDTRRPAGNLTGWEVDRIHSRWQSLDP